MSVSFNFRVGVSVALWSAALAAQLVLASPAHAQAQMEFIPSVSLFTVYDDNIFARADGSAGQMMQLRPSFEGSWESPTVRMLGLYSFDMQRSNFSTLSTLDARRHALGEMRFRTTPFVTLGLTTRYDRTNTPGELDLDTGVLGDRQNAERVELMPTLAWRLGPRTVMTSGYDWITEHLIAGERGTMHVGRLGWSRDVTSRTTFTTSYIGRLFVDHVDAVSDYQSHAVLLGMDRVLSPGTSVTLSAGPKVRARRGTDYEASANFTRATPRSRLAVDYWHGETIVLGVVGPVGVDSATSRMSWPIRQRFEVATVLGASDISTLDDRTTRVYRGTLTGSWSPGGIYSIAASYDADYQDGSIRNPVFIDGERVLFDERVLRHVFRVSVTIAPRYRRSILPPDEAARAKGVTR
jgi:hypothetical protein